MAECCIQSVTDLRINLEIQQVTNILLHPLHMHFLLLFPHNYSSEGCLDDCVGSSQSKETRVGLRLDQTRDSNAGAALQLIKVSDIAGYYSY